MQPCSQPFKVVSHNCFQIFQPYANFWLRPLCQLILSTGLCDNGLNYFIVDLVVTMLSRHDTVIPQVLIHLSSAPLPLHPTSPPHHPHPQRLPGFCVRLTSTTSLWTLSSPCCPGMTPQFHRSQSIFHYPTPPSHPDSCNRQLCHLAYTLYILHHIHFVDTCQSHTHFHMCQTWTSRKLSEFFLYVAWKVGKNPENMHASYCHIK